MRSRRLIIACSVDLAEAARSAEARSGRTLSQLVNGLLYALPEEAIDGLADFAEPQGRSRRQGARLPVRVAPRWHRAAIRRAIGFICGTDSGQLLVVSATDQADLWRELERSQRRIEQLLSFLERLSFQPIPGGVRSQEEARYILGLAPTAPTDTESLIARFRSLAPVYHPDSGLSESHTRMVQLLEARRYLANWR
jgi:hypothetical protein